MYEEPLVGLERLREIFESRRILRLSVGERFPNTFTYYLTVRAYEKEWDFTLSGESLSDLPNMKTYQESANRLARTLESRFKNFSPRLFYSTSGRCVEIEAFWPAEPLPQRTASYIRTEVRDFKTGDIARCYVTVTYQQSLFELKPDPFVVHEGMVNSIRTAVDAATLTFYPKDAHPTELQEIKLSLAERPRAAEDVIDSFLLGKVFWLAFRADNSARTVWIADPWDASYLGTTPREMVQAAQILAARNEIAIDETGEFAAIGRELLARAREFARASEPKRATRPPKGSTWDLFISHAAEDKETFVRPLVRMLQARGVKVWFDEYTLRLGDSLRRTIDEGLARSRFGVVVLSPAFFSKEWPQRELDALVAREADGGKVILPVWHNISAAGIRQYSPILADRFAVSSSQGISIVVDRILEAVAATEGGR
jgi:TIR domain